MAGSSPLQLYPYPTTVDQASPVGIQSLAAAMERQVVAVFADAATRDSRWSSATGLANGAMCFLTSTGELQLRSGGTWVVIGGRSAAYAMNSGLVNASVVSGGGGVNVTVTFTVGRFSQAPQVFGDINSGAGAAVGATLLIFSVTTTGCTIQIAPSGATFTGTATIPIFWQALQMLAGNGVG